MTIFWGKLTTELYCVDSGRPVSVQGDRCLSHGANKFMCYTARRAPRCEHPYLSKNHPYPKCSECGNMGMNIDNEKEEQS